MKRKTSVSICLTFILSTALMLILMGCSSLPASKAQPATQPTAEVKLEKAFITGNYDGNKLLVLNLNVKNNSDHVYYGASFSMNSTAKQKGTTLSEGYLPEKNPDALPLTSSINPKSEGPAQIVYVLKNDTDAVEVTFMVDTVDFSKSVEIFNQTFDLSNIDVHTSEAEFEVTIDNVSVTDDGKGQSLLVVETTFTNNSDTATSYGSAIREELYQNGKALKSGSLPYKHPSYNQEESSNSYTNIKQGASVKVQKVYALNDSTTPVELTFIDSESYDHRTILNKKIDIATASSAGQAA